MLREEFYYDLNKEKRAWFFEKFNLKTRQKNWRRILCIPYQRNESYYVFHMVWKLLSSKGSPLSFLWYKCTKNWETGNGEEIYVEYPPLREFKISHDDNSITTSPFKIKPNNDIEAKDLRNIAYQNNFTN